MTFTHQDIEVSYDRWGARINADQPKDHDVAESFRNSVRSAVKEQMVMKGKTPPTDLPVIYQKVEA